VVGLERLLTEGPADDQMALLFLAMCAGPSISGLLFTYICDGRQGLRDLKERLLNWKVGARWYAAAILTAPVLVLSLLFILSIIKPAFIPGIFSSPDKTMLVVSGILGGLVAGICEELGWTGFVVPRMRKQNGLIATGVIVGLLWGLWHLPLFLPGDPSGEVPSTLYLAIILFSQLPAYRVLMVWLYDKTSSLFLTILMHMSLTFCALSFQSVTQSGIDFAIYDSVLAAVIWVLILLIIRKRPDSAHPELP
jgi:membrane protease YdiL (CAAX protease family)